MQGNLHEGHGLVKEKDGEKTVEILIFIK